MSANNDPRHAVADTYTYRRALSARELLPAIGIGAAAGAVAFYLARLMLQRTPVTPEELVRPRGRRALRSPEARGG